MEPGPESLQQVGFAVDAAGRLESVKHMGAVVGPVGFLSGRTVENGLCECEMRLRQQSLPRDAAAQTKVGEEGKEEITGDGRDVQMAAPPICVADGHRPVDVGLCDVWVHPEGPGQFFCGKEHGQRFLAVESLLGLFGLGPYTLYCSRCERAWRLSTMTLKMEGLDL